ncbi:MAG: hypothetical protein M1821_002689 [Bathelium mastoideum]|nr:MAG: hypothetical protein M1821_002689 [Bathelium mastoideum]
MTSTFNTYIDEVQRLAIERSKGTEGSQEALVEAIDRLKYAAQTPWEILWESRFQMLNSLCKRIAMEMGVIDAIAQRKGSSVTSCELAKETGYEKEVIERVLHVLTSIHIFDEVGESTYAANDVTLLLGTKEGIAAEKYFCDFLYPIGAQIVPCMRSYGLQQFTNPSSKTPFEYSFGAPIFEFISQPCNLSYKQSFDLLMSGRRTGAPNQWFTTYPAAIELLSSKPINNGFPPGPHHDTLLVDIAGNKGHDLLSFYSSLPGHKTSFSRSLVLQDLPLTFTHLTDAEDAALADAGIQKIEYDFFTPQPIIGARAYFLRDICHDWPDHLCNKFLKHTAEAMTPGYSRLLIEDHIVEDVEASHRAAASDMLMMLILTGKERTRSQWKELVEGVGLRIVKFWEAGRGLQGVIECVKDA